MRVYPGSSLVVFKTLLLLTTLHLTAPDSSAQEAGFLDVFGYFQANFQQVYDKNSVQNSTIGLNTDLGIDRNSFSLQQINLFLRKDLNQRLMAWLNFEFTNSFSTERNWGTYNIEEAWIKYDFDDRLRVKAGLLVPIFNNLNTVKNRMPYLPYIFRPLVYESTISELVDLSAFTPKRAFFQVYGTAPAGEVGLNYAAYLGNSDANYMNSDKTKYVQTGIDTTQYLLFGGKIGLQWKRLRAGVSGTFDHDNKTAIGLGDQPRVRVGFDLGLALGPFSLEGERIIMRHTEPTPDVNTDKQFHYLTIQYDWRQSFFGYVSYGYLEDKELALINKGLNMWSIGAGYRSSESLTLKAQYIKLDASSREPYDVLPGITDLELEVSMFTVAFSVFF